MLGQGQVAADRNGVRISTAPLRVWMAVDQRVTFGSGWRLDESGS